MKRLYYVLKTTLIVLFLTSCEEEDLTDVGLNEQERFINFEDYFYLITDFESSENGGNYTLRAKEFKTILERDFDINTESYKEYVIYKSQLLNQYKNRNISNRRLKSPAIGSGTLTHMWFVEANILGDVEIGKYKEGTDEESLFASVIYRSRVSLTGDYRPSAYIMDYYVDEFGRYDHSGNFARFEEKDFDNFPNNTFYCSDGDVNVEARAKKYANNIYTPTTWVNIGCDD